MLLQFATVNKTLFSVINSLNTLKYGNIPFNNGKNVPSISTDNNGMLDIIL